MVGSAKLIQSANLQVSFFSSLASPVSKLWLKMAHLAGPNISSHPSICGLKFAAEKWAIRSAYWKCTNSMTCHFLESDRECELLPTKTAIGRSFHLSRPAKSFSLTSWRYRIKIGPNSPLRRAIPTEGAGTAHSLRRKGRPSREEKAIQGSTSQENETRDSFLRSR